MTSIGHTQPRASTSSWSSPRGRPGCTRYQWPSSMASVTAPRNAAPASVRRIDTTGLPPASSAPATRPTTPMTTGTRSSTGGNSGPRSAVAGPPAARVDARHRRHPGGAPVVLGLLAADPGAAPGDRDDEADQARCGDAERRHLAHRHHPEGHPGGERTEGHQQVDAPQQPAVAQADLAPPRREPAEGHAPDRPLQQHRGGVEADHGPQGIRASGRGEPVERRCDVPCRRVGRGLPYPVRAMSRLVPLLAAAVLAVTVTGCVTGERPTLAESPVDDRRSGRRRGARAPRRLAARDVHGRLRRADQVRRPALRRRPSSRRRPIGGPSRSAPSASSSRGPSTATCELDTGRVQRHDRRRDDQQHPAGAGLLRHERGGPPPPRRRGPRRRRRRRRRRRSPASRRRACRSPSPGPRRSTAPSTTARWPASTPPTWSSS